MQAQNTSRTLDLAVTYNAARLAYVPEPDSEETKSPSALAFQSSWHGFRAVCEAVGLDSWDYSQLWHDATIAGYEYADLVRQMASAITADPAEPKQQYVWDPEPMYDPARARAIFCSQYKAKFPGQRVTSKHANGLWKELESKAQKMAWDEYSAAIETRNQRLMARVADFEKRYLQPWEQRCERLAKMRAFVAAITPRS